LSLGDDRRKFTPLLAVLIQYAQGLGYGVAIDFVKRCDDCPIGHKESLHKMGLAVDLNLYMGRAYLETGFEHHELHDFWDSLGGNKRIDADLNHYSYGDYGGVR
jgi:hypothetical protein